MFKQKEATPGGRLTEDQSKHPTLLSLVCTCTKIGVLLIIWLFSTVFLIIRKPHVREEFCAAVEPNKQFRSPITAEMPRNTIELELRGKIDVTLSENASLATENSSSIVVWLQHADINSNAVAWKGDEWKVYLLEKETREMTTLKNLFRVSEKESSNSVLQLAMTTTSVDAESLIIVLDTAPIDKEHGVIYACLLLLFLYVLIIWDITDRTFAALITTTAAIGVLALMDTRPSLYTILSWIDVETLMLLFGMMIMVAILSETGIFDYIAVLAFRYSRGHVWLLMFFLCLFSAIVSAFLDNVTMVLLMVPLTIRLCEVMSLRPSVTLITIAIFTNIGGTLTPVGDPPNVIIATNYYVAHSGIDFFTFTIHMFPGVFFGMVVTFIILYTMLRRKIYLVESPEKRRETSQLDNHLVTDIAIRVQELRNRYQKQMHAKGFYKPVPNFIETLADLEVRHKIRNVPLLIKCGIALCFAILLFFLHSLPVFAGGRLPWIAVLAALLLLILANIKDLQIFLVKVEWSTLLFFASLFVLMEVITELGLIEWICERTVTIVLSVSKEYQLMVAMSLLLWISAMTSAFVDNIPITTMMLKLAIALDKNKTLDLPFPPLIWALAFGACFGGNGTLIGASANVVTAGLASQHGYKITFMEFFIIGFPVMIGTVFVVWIYLLCAHSLLNWH